MIKCKSELSAVSIPRPYAVIETDKVILLVVLIAFLICTSANAELIIDDFSSTQFVPADSFSCVTDENILGGERDVRSYSYCNADINSAVAGQFYCYNDEDSISSGTVSIIYDGLDNSIAYNINGLNNFDLTQGGQYTGLLVTITDISGVGGKIHIIVEQENKGSDIYVDLPAEAGEIFFAFDDFEEIQTASEFASGIEPYPVGPIDFTDVGYIGLFVTLDPGTHCTIDSFNIIPEPATIVLLGLGGLIIRKR